MNFLENFSGLFFWRKIVFLRRYSELWRYNIRKKYDFLVQNDDKYMDFRINWKHN